MKIIKRSKQGSIIKVQVGKGIKEYFMEDFLKLGKADGVIRIQNKEYRFIPEKGNFTHFNIQNSDGNPGDIFLLPRIVKHGFYKNGKEQTPLLSFKDIYICKILERRDYLPYSALKESDFKYSMSNIKNEKELKNAIWKRYSKSIPELSKSQIFDAGISMRKVKILGKTTIEEEELGSTREGFGKAMLELGKKKNIVALTADLKDSMKLTDFAKKYPKQFYEFGIAEQNMMSAAAGMTIAGKIPFVTSYAAFNPGRNWDQLRVSVCYSNVNVKVIGGHAGLTTGPDGASHQCLEDLALTRTLPNLIVISPCDEEEARKATIVAAKHKGPVYIRLSREKSKNLTNKRSNFKIGEASVLEEGKDITIIATGLTVQFAIEAAKILKKEKIKSTVINLSTIKPLDEKTILKYAKKTNKIITIEEHQKAGGMGSAISEFLSQNYPTKMKIIGVDDSFGESGNGYELLKKYNISVKEIVSSAKSLNNS